MPSLRALPTDRVRRLWHRYYWLLAGALAAAGVAAMGRPFRSRHGLAPPLPHRDTVILEYVGWFVARGHTLYVDVWEIKPPLAFLPSYLLARLTGGDVYAVHLGGMVLTALGLVVTIAVASRLVGRVADSPTAGLLTGVAFLSVPGLFYAPWVGYKAKALVFAAGTLALEFAYRDRPGVSGLSAGLAVGGWQLAVVFPLLTTAYVARTRSRAALRRHLAGGGVAAALILLAVLALGSVRGFLAEVVLAPLVLRTDAGGFGWGYLGFFPDGLGVALTLLGVAGLVLAVRRPTDRPAWPLALCGLLVVGVLALDFDGLWDVLSPLLVVAVGVGLLAGHLSRRAQVDLVVVLSTAVVAGFAPTDARRPDPVELTDSDGLPPAVTSERETVYWNARPVRSCRFFGAGTQRSLLDYYPDADRLAEEPCGRLDPYWRALRGQNDAG